jgi:hypothetical protein
LERWKKGYQISKELGRRVWDFDENAAQIVGSGAVFWMAFGTLGSFSLTRPIWAWAMTFIVGYIIADILLATFLDIDRSEKDPTVYQATIPRWGNKIVPAYATYFLFVLLMVITAAIAGPFALAVGGQGAILPLWESSFGWSIPVSVLVSLRLLKLFRAKLGPRTTTQP